MSIPILGSRVFVCVACAEPVRKTEIGGALVCMNEPCARFGLLSLVAKDPVLEAEQKEEAARLKEEDGGDV